MATQPRVVTCTRTASVPAATRVWRETGTTANPLNTDTNPRPTWIRMRAVAHEVHVRTPAGAPDRWTRRASQNTAMAAVIPKIR